MLLLVVILVIAIFFLGVIIYAIFVREEKFEMEMLIVLGVSILGFLSSWFQIKTVKLYHLDKQGKVLPIPSKKFWTFNIAFAGALIALFGWTFYSTFIRFNSEITINSPELARVLFVFLIPVSIGGFIFFESYYLKQMLKKNKERKLILEIDNIKGEQEK